ncbi:MAG: hypothetical protein HY648_08900 [Acidobacteria bacterium]|nr:hypothetical protein [Acidobacteriota bacterium]
MTETTPTYASGCGAAIRPPGEQTGGQIEPRGGTREVTLSPIAADDVTGSLAARIKALGVVTKSEELALQEKIGELTAFAQSRNEETPAIHFPNSVLPISSPEWQALLSSFPPGERSFRADFSRALRRTVGLLAALQEELALYQIRQASEHLWKKHLNSLVYLAHCAGELLPELMKLQSETRNRGLSRKEEHLASIVARLQQHLETVAALDPQQEAEAGNGLRIDPKWEENRLQSILKRLVEFASTSEEPVQEIPLGKTVLSISPTLWQALTAECPDGEISFRAEFNQALRRAVGLLAAIQEEMGAYQANAGSQFSWKKPLNSLRYLERCANEILPRLEALVKETQLRNLSQKAEHLAQSVAQLRQYQAEIGRLYQRRIGGTASHNTARAAAAAAAGA